MSDQTEREAQWSEAVREGWERNSPAPVIALADQEVAEATAGLRAEVERLKRDASETVALWSSLYREAVGTPPPEHMARRMEQVAEQWEAAKAETAGLRAEVQRLRKYAPSPEVERLLEAGSLGSAEVLALRETVPRDRARLVVRLSEEMARAEAAEAREAALRQDIGDFGLTHGSADSRLNCPTCGNGEEGCCVCQQMRRAEAAESERDAARAELHAAQERLRAVEAQNALLRSALGRTEANFRAAVNGKPVRDMAENLAENRAALASPVESDAEAGAADTQGEGEPELCGLEACEIGGFCQARSGCKYGEAAADREGGEGR